MSNFNPQRFGCWYLRPKFQTLKRIQVSYHITTTFWPCKATIFPPNPQLSLLSNKSLTPSRVGPSYRACWNPTRKSPVFALWLCQALKIDPQRSRSEYLDDHSMGTVGWKPNMVSHVKRGDYLDNIEAIIQQHNLKIILQVLRIQFGYQFNTY